MPIAQIRQNDCALSSGESEIMGTSELLTEAKLTQHYLEFCGMGLAHSCQCRWGISSQKRCGKSEASGRQAPLVTRGNAERELQGEPS